MRQEESIRDGFSLHVCEATGAPLRRASSDRSWACSGLQLRNLHFITGIGRLHFGGGGGACILCNARLRRGRDQDEG